MISIRTKLICLICLLVVVIDIVSCLYFVIYLKRNEERELEKLGTSMVMLISQDNEVKYALNYDQPAFLHAAIKKIEELDFHEERAYWRIANALRVIIEEKALYSKVQMNEVPVRIDSKNPDTPLINHIITSSGEVIYDFSVPIIEKQAFSEEIFATQILSEDKISAEIKQPILGFVQVGLSTHKLNARIRNVVLYSIIPVGLVIIIGGVCTAFFLTKYIVSPLQYLASITLDVARGNLARVVDVRSKDEIGQLSRNFNQMTKALEKSHADLKQEIVEHLRTEELLQYRVKIEELIAIISTSFINLAPDEIDNGISHALKMIGEYAGVDRTYVCLYSDDEKKKMDNTHEWCAEGVEPQIENLKGVPVEHFPWGIEKLNQFEVIHIPRVNDMPDCARAEKELQTSQSVQSFVVVPMLYGGSLVGFLGFDSVKTEKTWSDEDISLLKIVGEIFVNAIEHRRKEVVLRKAYDELEMRVKERTIELSRTNELLKEEIVEHKKAREELKKYEILISQITDLPYICDAKGNILFVNHMFKRLTGHKPEEFLGKPFAPLFDEENLKKAIDVYTRTLQGESPQYELYFRDTGILCEYKNLPLRDENGNIIGVIGTARDITERKRMESMLRETNQTLSALVRASPLAITILDPHGYIKMWNPSAERIFGWTEQEVIGHFLPIVPEDKQNEFHVLRDRVLKGESLMGVELRRRKRDDSLVDISLSAAPLYDAYDNIVGIVGIIADITERQKMVDALHQAKKYAENLIETANVLIVGLDVHGNVKIFNKTAEKITGYKKEEIIGKNFFETIVPKDKFSFAWNEFTKWQISGQYSKTFETPILIKSGKKRYISWQNSEVVEQGRASGIIFFGNDITEQKRMNALVERMRLTTFVKDVSIALTGSSTLQTILNQCAESLVDNLDAAFARIWTLNEKENVLELQASAGMYTHIDGLHSRVPVGSLKIGLIARDRHPKMTNFVIDDPLISDKDWVRQAGIVAFAGYPLIVRDHLVGVIAMFSRKRITEFTLRAMASAADIIALGIDRKWAENALRMSEYKYRMLLENLPQRIFYKDINSIYVSCNENYAKDLHIRPDEIAGKTDYDLFPKILADKYSIDDQRIIKSGQPEDIEEKYIKDGKELIVHTVKTPIKDEKGSIVGILGIFWDITEKVILQREAIRSRHLASLGELAAGVAHEINNPITGIINCAQILSDKSKEGSEENDIASRIIKEGKRIANIINNLLSFSRPGEGKEKRNNIRIGEILSDTLILTGAQLRADGIKLILHIPQGLPEIIADPQQLEQVFLNIIINARYALNQKYPSKHDNKILEILGEEVMIDNASWVKVTFYDHGTGIPANIRDKVMDPFFTTKPRGRGTGLGLSMSHSIINEHDGKILIDSVEGEFTKIAVILPMTLKPEKKAETRRPKKIS